MTLNVLFTLISLSVPSIRAVPAILDADDRQPICGSVLLTPNVILTAGHCVVGQHFVPVRCGGVDIPGTVVASSLDSDLGLIRLTQSCSAPVSKLADSLPDVGTSVWAIGYPDRDLRMSHGVVSGYDIGRIIQKVAEDENSIKLRVYATHPVLISDAKVFFGNSGGGLFTDDGRLVGICSQLNRAGYGIWIPVPNIVQFIDDFIDAR